MASTTKPRSVQIWTNSHYIENETLHNLAKLTEQYEKVIRTHKEESRARIILDQEDRSKLQKFMSICIHPFDKSVKELYNIYTGETCLDRTSVNKHCEIGTEFMLEFKRSLPKGFHS